VSAPSLPDVFGNYVLSDFVEVVAPQAISWWPQTVGWLWLGAALLAVLLRYSWRQLHHWYRNRYRREAAARLKQLAQADATHSLLLELNKLLKLTALAVFSREHVARLSGAAWVDFLNRHCPSQPFSADLGNLLAKGVYENAIPADATRQALLAACLEWINQHESPAHV
jgi:Domain of unknown function (DUF4381)